MGKAIALLLEIIGKKMRVSRAYIFELEEDGQYLRNTFEWCDEQTQPEIGNLQRVELESIKDSIDVLKEKGALYIRDVSKLPKESGTRMILEPQGIHAMLQCAVRSGGTFKGTVGFDECRGAYVWTKEQVEVLSLVADIVDVLGPLPGAGEGGAGGRGPDRDPESSAGVYLCGGS